MSESRKVSIPGQTTGATTYAATAVTTVSLTANTNNLVITGLEGFSLVEMSSTGNYNLTGVVVPDETRAWELKIFNGGVNNIIIKDNDIGSIAKNRFLNGTDFTVQPSEGFSLVYRPSVQRWSSPGKNI